MGPSDVDTGTTYPAAGDGLAIAQAISQQGSVAFAFLGPDLRISRSVMDPSRFRGLCLRDGMRLADLVPEADRAELERRLRGVLATGEPLTLGDSTPYHVGNGLYVALSTAMRRVDAAGSDLVVTLVNVTEKVRLSQEQERLQRRMDLAWDLAHEVGTTSDMRTTAKEAARALGRIFPYAIVDLHELTLVGGEPEARIGGGDLGLVRAAAVKPDDAEWPEGFVRVGGRVPRMPGTDLVELHQLGRAGAVQSRDDIHAQLGHRPELIEALVVDHHSEQIAFCSASCATVHRSRQLVLGGLQVWKLGAAFSEAEVRLVEVYARLLAKDLDSARCYMRERRLAQALQQQLLPPRARSTAEVEAVGRNVSTTITGPSGGPGGDWYDVLSLPGRRVALVVGDVVGHGLPATATMGRMRMAVTTLVHQDLPPDELLAQLTNVVDRLGQDDELGTLGSTCVAAIWDPVTRRCTMASAGHPPPVLVTPDGSASLVDVRPGTPLGLSGYPVPITEFDVEPGSVLAMYTDGLTDAIADASPETDDEDANAGTRRLRQVLEEAGPDADLEETASLLVDRGEVTRDDVTLLLARLRPVPEDDVATWFIPPNEEAPGEARVWGARQLERWGIDDTFTAELTISELVTNALRYGRAADYDQAAGNATLRLIRDPDNDCVVIETADSAAAAPHLRQAADTDEGGRGLAIVGQICRRQGYRWTDRGKVVWAELDADFRPCPQPTGPGPLPDAVTRPAAAAGTPGRAIRDRP